MGLTRADLISDFMLDNEIVVFDDDGNETDRAIVLLKDDHSKLTELVNNCVLAENKERDTENCNISDVITPFWLWLVREANVDVIDAENAIEVHGFNADNKPLIPVISFKELIELYKSQNGL